MVLHLKKMKSQSIEESSNKVEMKLSNDASSKNENKEKEIRSFAIVKKSQFEFPVSFHELQSNTDLKTPPPNWLRGQYSVCFPNLAPKRSDFTSFIMGYQFPDCITEVDIISDAENIKKLLKMAYKSNTQLSMIVHRIGNTLLIDELDIYKYLLRQSQFQWKWMRNFFVNHVMENLAMKDETAIVRPNNSRAVVQSKNLLSKFLYHSVRKDLVEQPATVVNQNESAHINTQKEESVTDPPIQPYNRNVIWKFEDLCMLIGTEMPIFGGGSHPCVSLRLRDMDNPINVLTGIDYWLDNLMCNVPEVVMCYHQDGIVQKYELVKTEDLPHLPNSQFSTQLIRDIAHNILSFLKTKAAKEGHTYWLFKEKNDDIVKLYDLTSLYNEDPIFDASSSQSGDSDHELDSPNMEANPFTAPVAILLYYVAKNIWYTQEDASGVDLGGPSKSSTVRNLLENCLSLLEKENCDKYSKILCHSHIILSEIFLSQDCDPDNPNLNEVKTADLTGAKTKSSGLSGVNSRSTCNVSGTTSKKKKTKSENDSNPNTISLANLCHHRMGKRYKQKAADLPSLSTDINERCEKSLSHVLSGLNLLIPREEFVHNTPESNAEQTTKNENSDKCPREEKQTFANRFVPIPLPYEPLYKDTNLTFDTSESRVASESIETGSDANFEKDKSRSPTLAENCTESLNDTKLNIRPADTSKSKTSSNLSKNSPEFSKTAHKNIEDVVNNSESRETLIENKNSSKLHENTSKIIKSGNNKLNVYSSSRNDENIASISKKSLAERKVMLETFSKSLLNSQLKSASWPDKMKFQLLRKVSLIYMVKGRIELKEERFGRCLRYAKMSIRSWCSMLKIIDSSLDFNSASQDSSLKSPVASHELNASLDIPLPVQPFLLAGDSYYNLCKRWDLVPAHAEEFNALCDRSRQVFDIFERIIPVKDYSWLIKVPCDCVEALVLSYKCFEISLRHCTQNNVELKRRIASLSNELGCVYMNQADQMCKDISGGVKCAGDLWTDSWKYLEEAFRIFTEVKDEINLALIHCNKGRYLRLYAYYYHTTDHSLNDVRKYYEKAFSEYETALKLFKKSNMSNKIYDSVLWEFSTALFGYATIVQETVKENLENEELTKHLCDIYNKCLKFCQKKSGSHEPLYQYRTAVIHIRLAGIYHNKYRSSHRDEMLHLAKLYYEKSAANFLALDSSVCDVLKVHLDYVVLLEDSLSVLKNSLTHCKALLHIFKLLINCEGALKLVQEKKFETDGRDKNESKSQHKNLKNKSQNKFENKSKVDVEKKTENSKKEIDGKKKSKVDIKNQNKVNMKNEEDINKSKVKPENKEIKTKNTVETKSEVKRENESIGEVSKDEETSEDSSEMLTSLLQLYEKKLSSTVLALLKHCRNKSHRLSVYENDLKKIYKDLLSKEVDGDISRHLKIVVPSIGPSVTKICSDFGV